MVAITSKLAQVVPIAKRAIPGYSWRPLIFNIYFFSIAICLHAWQIVALPLAILSPSRKLFFVPLCRIVKEQAGHLLVSINQIFAPTTLLLTFEEDLQESELAKVKDGDLSGRIPAQHVMITNHQIYSDWVYIWNLLYAAKLHAAIIILLKKSLKWIPIIGPGLQMSDFIFMAQSWKEDKSLLRDEMKRYDPASALSVLIFPEGTLVSRKTKPISSAYAKKMSKRDYRNLLLPRSTGLLFCLRALKIRFPDLTLVDLTLAYGGIPADSYGQDFYTLQSTFARKQPPPGVHVHIRKLKVSEIPLGVIRNSNEEASAEEKAAFEDWLEDRWTEKDRLLDHFYATGSFVDGPNVASSSQVPVEIKLRPEDARYFAAAVAVGGLMTFKAIKWAIARVW